MRRPWILTAVAGILAAGVFALAGSETETVATQVAVMAPAAREAEASGADREPAEDVLPVPFVRRPVLPPESGEALPAETASYCDEAHWKRTDVLVERPAPGTFAVDEEAWQRTLTGTRVGLASWMSQCHQAGAPIQIVSAATGALLATYDDANGLNAWLD